MFSSGAAADARPRTSTSACRRSAPAKYEWRGFAPLGSTRTAIDPAERADRQLEQQAGARASRRADDNVVVRLGPPRRSCSSARCSARQEAHARRASSRAMNEAATQDLRAVRVWPTIAAVLERGTAPNAARRSRWSSSLDAWRADGASRLDRDLDGKIDDPGAAIMDACVAEDRATRCCSPCSARSPTARGADPDRATTPNAGGSLVRLRLVRLRRQGSAHAARCAGASPFATRYCGGGDLAALPRLALGRARRGRQRARRPPRARPGGVARRRDRRADPFGPAASRTTMRWTNRPTFQQVITFSAPSPSLARLGADAREALPDDPGADARAAGGARGDGRAGRSTTAAPTSAPCSSAASTRLRRCSAPSSDVLLFTASGTGAMESAVANLSRPATACSSSRPATSASAGRRSRAAYGADVDAAPLRVGRDAVGRRPRARGCAELGGAKVVFLTQSETSTGVVADVQALAAAAKEAGALVVVDAISSLGAVPLETDAWGIDVVVSGSQKALMTPPGLGVVVRLARPRARRRGARPRRASTSTGSATRKAQAKLDAAVHARRLARRRRSTSRSACCSTRASRPPSSGTSASAAPAARASKAMGLELFSPGRGPLGGRHRDPRARGHRLRRARARRSATASGSRSRRGQGALKGKIFRIGHIGCFDIFDITTALAGGRARARGAGRGHRARRRRRRARSRRSSDATCDRAAAASSSARRSPTRASSCCASASTSTSTANGDLAETIGDYDAIVIRSATKLTADLIERADRLKVIGRAGVGVDNVDVEAATRRGIVVANAPESTVVSAAEHTSACCSRSRATSRRRTPRSRRAAGSARRCGGHRARRTRRSACSASAGSASRSRAARSGSAMRVVALRPVRRDGALPRARRRARRVAGRRARGGRVPHAAPAARRRRRAARSTRDAFAQHARRRARSSTPRAASSSTRRRSSRRSARGKVAGAALDVFSSRAVLGPAARARQRRRHAAPRRLDRGGAGPRRRDRRRAGRGRARRRARHERRQHPGDRRRGPRGARPVHPARREARPARDGARRRPRRADRARLLRRARRATTRAC